MTTAPAHSRPNGPRPLGWLRHSVVLAGRSLAKTTRNPGPIVNGIVTLALVMVVFLYLFGSSVAGSTEKYLQYLLPGILVTGAALAGLVSTGTNITVDLAKGVTDRFRSLPISRVAPLLGSVLADVLRFTVAVLVLFVIGAALGFRVLADSPVAAGLAAAGLAVLLGFGLSWITVLIGVLARDTNAVLAFSFIAFLPLQLGTSLAAPTDTLPGWLRTWAEVNPVTHAMNACRALLNGTSTNGTVTATVLWSIGLTVVLGPLAVRAYSRHE